MNSNEKRRKRSSSGRIWSGIARRIGLPKERQA